MREKLGGSTGSKKSANESVDAEWEATEALRENVKRIIKLVAKHEKAVKRAFQRPSIVFSVIFTLSAELTAEMNRLLGRWRRIERLPAQDTHRARGDGRSNARYELSHNLQDWLSALDYKSTKTRPPKRSSHALRNVALLKHLREIFYLHLLTLSACY